MRKASMNFKSGALYTKDGRKLADIDSGVVEWGVQVTAEAPAKSVATVTRNATGTIESKLQIGHLDVLSLMYGMRLTNNWLKMHGGLMARNGGKNKKRRLFCTRYNRFLGWIRNTTGRWRSKLDSCMRKHWQRNGVAHVNITYQ